MIAQVELEQEVDALALSIEIDTSRAEELLAQVKQVESKLSDFHFRTSGQRLPDNLWRDAMSWKRKAVAEKDKLLGEYRLLKMQLKKDNIRLTELRDRLARERKNGSPKLDTSIDGGLSREEGINEWTRHWSAFRAYYGLD